MTEETEKAEQKSTLIFWGGVGTVTGANFMLKTKGKTILVDCGLLQGEMYSQKVSNDNQKLFPYEPSSVDILFVTHSHIDHIGTIPKLIKEGFRGVIYSTAETKATAAIMFEDALKLSRAEPLYEKTHVEQALALWKEVAYYEKFECAPQISAEFLDAGHILGSSMVRLSSGGKNVLFTGDLGNSPSPILKNFDLPTGVDYLVMDSVYGDRNHEEKSERDRRLARIVRLAVEKKGVLLIAAFSLDRTQIVLYELNNLIEEGKVPSVPVFLDSPLSIKLTEIYKRSSKYFNQAVQDEIKEGDDIFNFPKLKTVFAAENSYAIEKTPNPKIIVASAGMSTGGRILHHEMNYLPGPENTLLLTGYQVAGSLGRRLEEGAKEVVINGKKIDVRAHVETISGYSAHADSNGLMKFVENTRDSLKKVFVVMGEPKSSLFLTQRLRDYLDVDAIYPERGTEYKIDF